MKKFVDFTKFCNVKFLSFASFDKPSKLPLIWRQMHTKSSEEELLLELFGPSQVGKKSRFINALFGIELADIGDGRKSC